MVVERKLVQLPVFKRQKRMGLKDPHEKSQEPQKFRQDVPA